jgi:hypothetical protein
LGWACDYDGRNNELLDYNWVPVGKRIIWKREKEIKKEIKMDEESEADGTDSEECQMAGSSSVVLVNLLVINDITNTDKFQM